MNARAGSFAAAVALTTFSSIIASPRDANASCRPSPEAVISHTIDSDAAYQACLWRERTGPEVSLHLGAGSALDPGAHELIANGDIGAIMDNAQRGGPGPVVNLALGWRVIPSLSFGAHLFYEWAGAANILGNATGHTDMLMTGVYGRFYIGSAIGIRRVEPWIGVGFDFGAAGWVTTTVTQRGSGTQSTTTVTLAGTAVPVEVGLDYNISPTWSVGLVGRLTTWIPYQRCSFGGCPDGGTLYPVPLLFVGIGTRALLPF